MNQGLEVNFSEKSFLAFKKLYCGYRQKYVVMKPEYIKTVNHYFTDHVIESHLKGYYALGVFAGDKATQFMTFDVDAGGKAAVRKVISALADFGIDRNRIYVSVSGKKGYHVDLFFDPFIYNDQAKNLYELVIWRTQLDPAKVEFRPTRTQAIKLPLGVHAKTGSRCWYVDGDKLDPIEDIRYVETIERIPAAKLDLTLEKWNKRRWNELYIEMICGGRDSLISGRENSTKTHTSEYLEQHRLTKSHTRHETMLAIARDLRRGGAKKEFIFEYLMRWYYQQDLSLIKSTEDEVREDAEKIAAWAEGSVQVLRRNFDPNVKPIVFTKYDLNYILKAKTSAARRVALLLYTYCKMYGDARISYETIADTVGCVEATAKSAISALVKARIISRESGGLYISNGKMVKKSNKYKIPNRREPACLADGEVLADEYAYTEQYEKGDFDKFYYAVLGGICTDECLAKYLTKPEIAAVRKARDEEQGIHNESEAG